MILSHCHLREGDQVLPCVWGPVLQPVQAAWTLVASDQQSAQGSLEPFCVTSLDPDI